MAGSGCRCSHSWISHEHFHAGTYCAACPCSRYRRRRWWHRAADILVTR